MWLKVKGVFYDNGLSNNKQWRCAWQKIGSVLECAAINQLCGKGMVKGMVKDE